MLCGRPALDRSLDEDECSLAKWAHESIEKGKVYESIDFNIKSQFFPKPQPLPPTTTATNNHHRRHPQLPPPPPTTIDDHHYHPRRHLPPSPPPPPLVATYNHPQSLPSTTTTHR
ncbi:hypothetical protein HanPI659440_Chr08g0314131 [Helianthus annuus]|nr:hypothetical protein HanPI659440_Chr08g0314131 [Helianthus annuus]